MLDVVVAVLLSYVVYAALTLGLELREPIMGEKSHVVYRDNESGRLISKEQADQSSKSTYTREHMPNPGRGDTGRGIKRT